MRQAATGIVVCLTLLLALCATAEAVGPPCPAAGTTFVVDPINAPQLHDGFNCPLVRLVIGADIPIDVQNWTVNALSVNVGPNPVNPALRVQVVNDVSSLSTISINTAEAGGFQNADIILNGASVKAHKTLAFKCTGANPPPGCKFKADQSDIIAAFSFSNPVNGGVLSIRTVGPIDIHTTNVHGGDELSMDSSNASITLICGGGTTGCQDPNLAKPQIVTDQCGDPIVFPCALNLPDAAALKSVCIGAEVVQCNGGHKEKRFTAATFIDVTGSTIVSIDHITFTCKTQDFRGAGATLESTDKIAIRCGGKVDIKGAHITADLGFTATSGALCPRPPDPAATPPDPGATEPCIDAHGPSTNPAEKTSIFAKPQLMTANGGASIIDVCNTIATLIGSGNPKLNNGLAPPYGNNVIDTAAECAPDDGLVIDH